MMANHEGVLGIGLLKPTSNSSVFLVGEEVFTFEVLSHQNGRSHGPR